MRKTSRSRWMVVTGAAALGVVLIAGAAAPRASEEPKKSSKGARTADLAPAQVQSFDITTTISGELEARNQIEIRSALEKDSTITEIVPEGSRVKAGDVILRLNSDDLLEQLQEEQLRVETARADLIAAENAYAIQISENESELREAYVAEELAELALSQWVDGDHKSEVLKNRLAVERAERDLSRLKDKLDQSKSLFERKFLSLDELKLDEIRYLEAEAELQTARVNRDAYDNFKAPMEQKEKLSDLFEAQAKVERVVLDNERRLASKEADRNNKRTQLSIRESRLERLNQQIRACTIVAPSDGLVVYATSMERNRWGGPSEGPLQIGQKVFPNQLLMVLPDTAQMIASVRVHESLAGRVRPGQNASVRVAAAGGKMLEGSVESIGVLAETGGWRDPNLREYTVRIALEPTADTAALKPSMRCEGQIVLGRVEEALSVPVQAVFNDNALRFVYVSEGSRYVRRPIKLGRRSDTIAEIAAGLKPGEEVLLREPSPGEVLSREWDARELADAGYTKAENGQIVLVGGPPEGVAGRGAGRQRPGATGGRPGGEARPAGGEAPVAQAPQAPGATPAPAAAPAGESKPAEAPSTK